MKKQLGDLPNQRKHFEWAKGFLIKGDRKYHPYTRMDFKFDNE